LFSRTGTLQEAEASDCRLAPACAVLDISLRTYQRWLDDDAGGVADRRKGSRRAAPPNKLSVHERTQILAVANSGEFASSPPSQIVLTPADRGQYLASVLRMVWGTLLSLHNVCSRRPVDRAPNFLNKPLTKNIKIHYLYNISTISIFKSW
jgi:hypothetical protein